MTTPAEALADPVGTVVSLVTAADPALEHDLVRRIVEQVGGGRSKRRRLAVELAGDPSVLTTGQSPASKVAGDLMLALRDAGATGISPPWCADCGRRVTSMQRRGEHWYCAPCFVRPEECAGCGNTRQVAFRDRQGRPRCSKCPDRDTRDPLLVLVGVITRTDPGLPAEAVTAAIEATVTKQAHLQKLAWLLHDKPGLLTGDGAKAPFPVVLRLIDALCEAGATRIRRPACPRCQRVIALSKQQDGLRICRNCFARARAVPCAKCGTTREPGSPRLPGPPSVPVLPGHRPGQPRRMRPLPPPQAGQHPHARRAGLRHLQPTRHPGLQQLRTHRPLHGLQDHRPATVRSMRPVTGTVLTVRAARPGPRRHS